MNIKDNLDAGVSIFDETSYLLPSAIEKALVYFRTYGNMKNTC